VEVIRVGVVELPIEKGHGTVKEFSIRPTVGFAELKDCQQIQREVWGMNETDVIPLDLLRVLSEQGGLVMNAYDRIGRPIGTSVSFPANHEGKLILYSHITGVVRDCQSKGVGLALKLAQRKFAIEEHYDLVCWTYDPMQSLNNWFNLNKLGVVARTYHVNYYAVIADRLNRGLESDRFLAEWWVKSPRVKNRIKSVHGTAQEPLMKQAMIVNATAIKNDVRHPAGGLNMRSHDRSILVEIPFDYEQLRSTDPSMLQRWRTETRKLYLHYFRSGYIATETMIDKSTDRRSFVKLERGSLQRILRD
jgi:predicted GNAT superfamily acetyltransferase